MITLRFSTQPESLTCFLIRQVTWSDYSHVDICTADGLLGASVDGVKLRPYTYEPKAKVLYMQTAILGERETEAYKFWAQQIGKPYDYGALVGILAHRDWRNPNKWFCSELAAAGFAEVSVPLLNQKDLDRVTPGLLLLSPYLTECSERQARLNSQSGPTRTRHLAL